MRRVFRLALITIVAALPASAAIVDRVAALVDQQVLTVSEISQMATIRFFPRAGSASDDEYRHQILDALIAQALRYRDMERFGPQDISKDAIEACLREIESRFASPADFDAALARAELSLDEVRALIKRQLQVEAYVQERFAPTIFITSDDIDAYYRGPYAKQRRDRGLPVPPLAEVRDEIRTLIRSERLQQEIDQWTTQLRARANVDVYTWK
jgi:peptidyl-prolyl cis-trans isomerase SurA